MRRTDIPATKANLLRLRDHFSLVTAGHELLEQKREVLLEELTALHREAAQLRRQLHDGLAGIYLELRAALLAAGQPPVEAEALAEAGTQILRMRERSVMGVVVPLLEIEAHDAPVPVTAPGSTPVAVTALRLHVRRLLPLLARVAEIEVSCRRLAVELQKTQRKVSALEHVFIPEYRDTIRFIEASLEEKEREALFQMKRLKGQRRLRAATHDD